MTNRLTDSNAVSRRSRIAYAALLSWVVLAFALPAGALQIQYTVRAVPAGREAAAHVHVVIRVSGAGAGEAVRFQMPVWSPGDYHVMDHARYVRDVAASTGQGQAKTVTHPDDNTWAGRTDGDGALTLSYDVPNCPPGFFSENVRVTDRWAFYNGPAVYMYLVGHKQDPVMLQVEEPDGWQPPVVPLPEAEGRLGRFSAPDYDSLADSPVLAGERVIRTVRAAGRANTVVFFRDAEGLDSDSYLPVLQKVAEEECDLMGGPPSPRYVFFFDVDGPGGGLEHLNSCRIGLPRRLGSSFLAGMAAHEYFHQWNVKRIRPFVLGPFDYIRPPQTHNLWFSEGVTSYYGDLSVRRSGLSTEQEYLQRLGYKIAALQSNPARKRVTADEASYRVWDSGNSEGYGGLSYYLKGELIGLCLDLKIRHLTQDRKSLDDVMRDMLARYGLPKPGFPEDGIRDEVIRAAGPEMGPFYDRLARSTEEMPFAECLGYAGLRLEDGSITADPSAPNEAVDLRKSWLHTRHVSASAAHAQIPKNERAHALTSLPRIVYTIQVCADQAVSARASWYAMLTYEEATREV